MSHTSREMIAKMAHKRPLMKALGLLLYFMKYIRIRYGKMNVNVNVVVDGDAKSNLQCPKAVISASSQNGLPLLNSNWRNDIRR